MVSCNGGLNQMRAAVASFSLLDLLHFSLAIGPIGWLIDLLVWLQICDMVAIARYMNVTLIVPELDKMSFWNDPRSVFAVES